MRVLLLAVIALAAAVAPAEAAEQSVEDSEGDWRIACFDENITEYRDCYVIRDSLAVLISGQGYEIVIVGHGYDRTPNTEVASSRSIA